MERYDYYEAVEDSLVDFINDREDEFRQYAEERQDIDKLREYVYDEAFISDSVTGNASGSYFFNAWKAEEAICHNLDLYEETCDEYGDDPANLVRRGAETADVCIRCYVLGQVTDKALERCGITQEAIDEWVAELEEEEDEV